MRFRRIEYLDWARARMGRARWDLAKSNIQALTAADLELRLEDVALMPPTEDGAAELPALIARRYGIAPTQVLVCSGATMGIHLAACALLEPGAGALVETPAYEPLVRVCEQRGAGIARLDRTFAQGWDLDLEQAGRAIGRGVGAVFLTNTHNPTGAATGPEKLRSLGQIARDAGATVVVSEAYLDGAFDAGLSPAVTLGPNLVSIGTLSKVYGLGGLRLGWLAGPEDVIARARVVFSYLEHQVPGPSESIALLALRRAGEFQKRCRDLVLPNLASLEDWLSRRTDFGWVRPAGGTVALLRLPQGLDARRLSARLLEEHDTLTVPGDFFEAPGFLRISLGTTGETLRQGLKHLAQVVDRMKGRA